MNELFKKIADSALGPELRIGVGVGPGSEGKPVPYDTARIKAQVLPMPVPELVQALSDGRIHAIVRGSAPATEMLPELKRIFCLNVIWRAALLDVGDRPVWLMPVGIDEGRGMEERMQMASALANLTGAQRFGIISKGRPEDKNRGKDIAASLLEGEELAKRLCKQGLQARHYGILLEQAMGECDAVIPPDGVSGNLIFRSLHLVAGLRSYGALALNMDRPYIDTSRSKRDLTDALAFAAFVATYM